MAVFLDEDNKATESTKNGAPSSAGVSRVVKPLGKAVRAKILSILAVLTILLFSAVPTVSHSLASNGENGAVTASAEQSFPEWFICQWGEDSLPVNLYKFSTTDAVPYALTSKSVISLGLSKVDNFFNQVIDLSTPEGQDFVSTNERILGTKIRGVVDDEDETGENSDLAFNSGEKVSPYDRFGVAGLGFTAYRGEWKYSEVKVCSTQNETKSLDTNNFYEGRKVPTASYEDTGKSVDPRSASFKGFGATTGASLIVILANALFFFTKLNFTIIMGLIGFAFTDIVGALGLDAMAGGDGNSGGIIRTLFQGVFMPLSTVFVVFTGLYIFYLGVFKRAFRDTIGVAVRTVALFIFAIVAFAFPLQVVTVPNNIAIAGQAVVFESLSGGMTGGSGICASDKGFDSFAPDGSTADIEDPSKTLDFLEKTGVRVRSAVGCQLWQMTLLRPWSEAQFGTGWEKLYSSEVPEGYESDETDVLGNSAENAEWVGEPSVPLGGDSFINNWAIFQISTQTDAHAPIGKEGEISPQTNGVANDWWRIVDATSNYSEIEQSWEIPSFGGNTSTGTITIPNPDIKTTSVWSDWTGGNGGSRLFIVLTSILVSALAGLAPVFFAGLSAVLAIEITAMLAVSPVFALFGIWANNGWEIFKGYAELVLNLTLQRILAGLLLAFSLVLTGTAIKIMEDQSYIEGIVILGILTIALIKSRHRLKDVFASISFSTMNMMGSYRQTKAKMASISKTTGSLAMAGGIGGISAKKRGGDLGEGVKAGALQELRNRTYSSNSLLGRSFLTGYEDTAYSKTGEIPDRAKNTLFCQSCGKPLELGGGYSGDRFVARDSEGNLYCQECYDYGLDEDAREVYFDTDKETTQRVGVNTRSGTFDSSDVNHQIREIRKEKDFDVKNQILMALAKDAGEVVGKAQRYNHSKKATSENKRFSVDIPESLKPYLNPEAIEGTLGSVFERGSMDSGYSADDLAVPLNMVFEAFATAIKQSSGTMGDVTTVELEEMVETMKKQYNQTHGRGNHDVETKDKNNGSSGKPNSKKNSDKQQP